MRGMDSGDRNPLAGCWAPKDQKVVVEQTSGRQRLNIHGAIDLETGRTRMIEVTTVDALSTIALLTAIASMYPSKRLIHVFLEPVTRCTPRYVIEIPTFLVWDRALLHARP